MGSKFDFYSPFFRATIITNPADRTNSRWPLWVYSGAEDIQRLSQSRDGNGLNALAYCTEVSVTLTLGYVPDITATLSPPIMDARKLIESPLIEWTSSLLEVVFGYTNGPDYVVLSPTFEGMIQQPEISFGADASVTLRARGAGASLAMREEVSQTFTKTSRLEQMKAVLRPYNLDVDDSAVTPESGEGLSLAEKPESTFTANQSAWFFALMIAKTCRCWIYLENTTVKLIPWNNAAGAEPAFKFVFYDHRDGAYQPSDGNFPILGISTSTPAVFLSGATKALRLHSYDSKTRESKVVSADDKTESPKRSGEGEASSNTSPTTGEMFSENIADPEQRKRATSAFDAAQYGMGIKIEVETLGVPTLFPGALISIAGVARGRLDGNYVVFDVTHSTGSGGYTTKFTAISNIGQLSTQLGFGPPATNPNTQTKNSPPSQLSSENSAVVVQPKAG